MTGYSRKKGTRTGMPGKVIRQQTTAIPLGPELDKRCLAYRGRGGERAWHSPEEFLAKWCSWDTWYNEGRRGEMMSEARYPYYNTETKKQPYKCPVCGGKGRVPAGFYSCYHDTCITDASDVQCRTCKGEGIIWG